ncbi:MAG: tetratricopeptide repeat protein [Desulfuromonadales bacterium]|nr:tetratricopeptide repeat protein [Desulfuromonadales bacterium]
MSRRLKVYVIDDAMELCQDLRGWLDQTDHEVTCSPAGRIMMHTLLEYQPNLIVLGMTRYAGEGMAIYRRLNNHRQLRLVPMIVVSDDASLEYEMLDAFDFQVRPFDRGRLQVCLERLSGSHKYLSEVSFAEFELTALKNFLREHSGLHFNQHNHRILKRGLMRRIQALRMESLPVYFRYLTATSDNYDEMNKLLGLLTVGETSFFRYRSHREALLHYVIPSLIQQNKSQAKLRIWSAGCSTGEEPYSLAILLLENFPELLEWDVQILATDINKRSLRQAREGLYGERSLRMMEDSLRQRYFEKVDNLFLISAQVKRMVRFDYLNLQTDNFPAQNNATKDVDLLSCRNVLIYFELETIRQIVAKFSQALRPQGYLFMGHSETMQNVSAQFQRHHQNSAFFYQRKAGSVGKKSVTARALPESSRSPEAVAPPSARAQNKVSTRTRDKLPVKTGGKAPLAAVVPKKQNLDQVKKVLRRDPDQLYRDALTAFDHEKFTEAGKLFEELLEKQPTNPKALIGKGLLLANQGKYSDARICCARALKEDDLLAEAYLLRGLILDMEGFLVRALVEYQKVLWLEPLFVMAHYLAAKIHDRLSDSEKRKRSLRNTVRALEQAADQSIIPFSGGLSRSVFLEIARNEMTELPTL